MKKAQVYNFLNISLLDVDTCATEWRDGIKSPWSKRLSVPLDNVDTICNKLYETFHPLIDEQIWKERFLMAIEGSGDEKKKITTLHSSSLLALLFFSGVTKDNSISIDQTNYNQVFFEIKNKVFPNAEITDKPSNIDILLVSDNSEDLLFIESKFTEYLDHGKIDVSDKYLNFYRNLFYLIPDSGLKLDGSSLQCSSAKNSKYIAGIKQMFSHIIGLATAPDESVDEKVRCLIEQAKSIRIIEVAHKWDKCGEFDNYADLYSKIFEHFNNAILLKCLEGEGCNPEKINRIFVDNRLMTYQEIMNGCPTYKLSDTVKNFYRL